MYTKEDLRKAFDAGFDYSKQIEFSEDYYDSSEIEAYSKAKNDEFEEFLDTLSN